MSESIAKRKREDNEGSLLKDEVEFSRLDAPFPRGGGSELAPLEIRRAAAEATSDVFNQMMSSKKQKKSKSKSKATVTPAQTRIEPLSFSKIKTGTLVLGVITGIKHSTSELIISLPNNLTGYCPSTTLDSKQIGRFLRFAVVEIGEAPKRRLLLSQDPELVNQSIDASELVNGLALQGYVESIEEKGVVLDLGESLGKGFVILPRQEAANLQEGEALMAFLKDSERRIKSLTLDTKISVPAVLSQPALVPGSLIVSAPVDKSSCMGSLYHLLGHIEATSDALHSQGSENAVRVLFSHPPTQMGGDRHLGVSRLPHILQLADATEDEKIGTVVNGIVTSVLPNLGLFLEYTATVKSERVGFAHISQIEGNEKVDLDEDSKYKVGTKHTARVMGVSRLDGAAYLSLDETVIRQKYMRITDVRIGDVVKDATIDRILPKGGVLVRVSKGIVGIASELQLSDAAMRNPELKYKVGQTVAARVLNVDLDRERVELTLKKSIVDFDGALLAGYEDLNGQETVGTVIRVFDAGAKVLFFGGVRGLLPVSEMSEIGAKPEELVRVGQTVKVHVLETEASHDRLIISTRPTSGLADHIGEVFTARVASRNKHEVRINLLPDLGEATLIGSSIQGDSGKKVKVNDELTVKVLTDRLATNERALVDAHLPRSVDELEVGQQLTGYVSGVQQSVGIFVGFAAGLVGLVPANIIGNSSWPQVGKVVKVVVDTVDFARKRVFLSLPSVARTVSATITAVKSTQLNVVTTDGQQGRVDISQAFESIDSIDDVKSPLRSFQVGQKLENLAMIGRHDARNHRFLPLSHRSGTHLVLELALHQPADIAVGKKSLAFVNNYSPDGRSLWVTISPTIRGQISLVDLSSEPAVLASPEEFFPVASALEVTVLKMGPKLALTALNGPSNRALVFSVDPLRLMVRLPHHKTSAISCVDSGDEFVKLESAFQPGDIVEFVRDSESGSRVSFRSKPHEPVKEGQVRRGYVSNISDGGVFVLLAPNVIGRVQIGQLSDKYLKNWKMFTRVGEVVESKVLSISPNSGKIELSLKRSVVTGRKQPNIDKIEVGRSYNGSVRRVESFGIFIDFESVSGLCHKSEISDLPIDDLARVFKAGDNVRVKVLAKDAEAGKISLGMKAKYFEDDDENEDEAISEADSVNLRESETDSENDDFASFDGVDDDENDSDSGDKGLSQSDDISMDLDSSDEESEPQNKEALSAGFNWSGDLPGPTANGNGSDSDDSDSSDDDEPRNKRRRKREEFVRDDTASLQTRLPQSAKDFERLLVSTPNSSVLWMNYMAFQLQLGEVDGARDIGRRALKTISQREEEERLNVWVALLNLEAQFGSKDSAEKLFKEAQQYMDALTIHLRMAIVYAQAGKTREALEVYKRAHKRFGGDSIEPWLAEMKFLFGDGNNKAAARGLADSALQRLPVRLHRDFTRQFALLEFESGDAEKGRTLFEALLASAPKRVDLWNVYIDQEIKHGRDETKIAALFDRVLEQRISMKQAKFFFKKWIDIASDQEYVKMRAREYVENRENKENAEGSDIDDDSN